MANWRAGPDVTPELGLALGAIASALRGRTPDPDLLGQIAPQCRCVVPEHVMTIEYERPKGRRPRLKAVYTISITGRRVDGRWHFTPGQFADLLSRMS